MKWFVLFFVFVFVLQDAFVSVLYLACSSFDGRFWSGKMIDIRPILLFSRQENKWWLMISGRLLYGTIVGFFIATS